MTLEVIRIGGLELRFLQSKESSDGSLDLFEMIVQPGARVPVAHFHENWDETVYGLTGLSTWRVDGRDVELEPGRAVFIKRGIVHSFRNDTQEPTTCLNILTPGVLGPGYFREMAALIASGPPDPELVKTTMLRHGLIPAAGF
jgi:quercetin dioxygenase-like cupin family protein